MTRLLSMFGTFSRPASEDRLRAQFDELARRATDDLDVATLEISDCLWRFGCNAFEVVIACDLQRGGVTGCTISYVGDERRSELLEIFYVDSISPILGNRIPAIQWRRDGTQMKDPLGHMKACFHAASVFVWKSRDGGAGLVDRIEEHLTTKRLETGHD